MVSRHETVVRILQVRFQSNHCFGCQLFDLLLQDAHVSALACELFEHRCQQLLASVGIDISKVGAGLLKLVRLLVEAVVRQVHI